MDDGQEPASSWHKEAERQVRDVLAGFRAELLDWSADEDLISSRMLDSLVFVSVLIALEERSGREVDPGQAPSAELRTIRGLAGVFYGAQDHAKAVSGS